MDKILYLLKHSGASTRLFWLGISGKLATEALALIIWLALFVFILQQSAFDIVLMLPIAIGVVALQWWVGQSAKQSFIGAYHVTHHLRGKLLSDIRKQPLSQLIGKGLGERMKLVTYDLKLFEDIFSHLVAEFFSAWVIPVAMVIFISTISPAIAATLLGLIVLAITILVIAEKRFRHAAQSYDHHNVQSANQILEYVACLPMLKSFGKAEQLAQPLANRIEDLKESGLGLEWAGGTGVLLSTFILEMSLPTIMAVSGLMVSYDLLTTQQWLAISLATIACIRPFARLAMFSALLRYFVNASVRLHKLAIAPQQTQQGQIPSRFDVALSNVGLSIGQQQILKSIDISVKQGQHIALVGPSGAGKSSILHLIAAFHQPNQGEIAIGGIKLEQMGTRNLYRSISYVTQDIQLLAGTLRDNLLIANQEATIQQLDEAIYSAGLEDLVKRLPLGIDSEIGENGSQLSGGERQRISIARAILHQAPIVLLDEVTSALDSHLQQHVITTLKKLCADKTVITVAHRLNTIIDVDRIYLIEDGSVTAQGTHTELLNSSPMYYQLWHTGHHDTRIAS
ncbi:ABC transporter ATP-binding protein [Vibrio intestinalis]|uniref:ABC transporter ATP-binding protein n=1 Tax=Vibrio intestinalis TaxID=2933291 RepID=UPI0021A740C4|nr:ABC transporter ATP-binding protein [Vibrio intestinalis]